MPFRLRPILSDIKQLYLKPATPQRFQEYLSMLQGDLQSDAKDNLELPLGGFNPMAKEHILEKIEELESIGAEEIMSATIAQFNLNLDDSNNIEIVVVLNIADDLKGAWTNFYTADYESKFKINGLVKRNFCVPYFWTSENYSESLIEERTLEYLNRTLYRSNHPQPESLEAHFQQEVFAAKDTFNLEDRGVNFNEIESFYLENLHSLEYDLIFNFFYTDEGSESLGYKKYGNKYVSGYEYAKHKSIR